MSDSIRQVKNPGDSNSPVQLSNPVSLLTSLHNIKSPMHLNINVYFKIHRKRKL